MSDPNMISIRCDLANFISEEIDMEVNMDFKVSLRNGVILCCLFKKVVSNIELGKWFLQPGEQLTLQNCNVTTFAHGCKEMGIAESDVINLSVFEKADNDAILGKLMLFLRTALNRSVVNDSTMQNIRRIIANYDHNRRKSLTKVIEEPPAGVTTPIFNLHLSQGSPFSPSARKSNRVVSEENRKLLLQSLEKELNDKINRSDPTPPELKVETTKEMKLIGPFGSVERENEKVEESKEPPRLPERVEEIPLSREIPDDEDTRKISDILNDSFTEKEEDPHFVDFEKFEREMGIHQDDLAILEQPTLSSSEGKPIEQKWEGLSNGEVVKESQQLRQSQQSQHSHQSHHSYQSYQSHHSHHSPESPVFQEIDDVKEAEDMGLYAPLPIDDPVDHFHLMDLLCAFEETCKQQNKRVVRVVQTSKKPTPPPQKKPAASYTARLPSYSVPVTKQQQNSLLKQSFLRKPLVTPKPKATQPAKGYSFSPIQNRQSNKTEFKPLQLPPFVSPKSKLELPMVLRYPMMSDYARLGKKMNSLPKEEIVYEGKSKIPVPVRTLNRPAQQTTM